MSMSQYANTTDYWKAQAEALRVDAERYQYLREQSGTGQMAVMYWPSITKLTVMNGVHLDAAIDAARAA